MKSITNSNLPKNKRNLILFLYFFLFLSNSCNSFKRLSNQTEIISAQLIPYRIGNNWGFSDTNGNIIIQPKYDEIEFTSGGFKVRIGKFWRLTDQNGKQIIPGKFSEIREFKDFGRKWLWLKKGENYALADSSGHILVPPKYEFSHYLKDDLYIVGNRPAGNSGHLRSKLGIYRNGKLVIPLKYETIVEQPSGQIVLTTESRTKTLIVKPNSVSLEKYRPIYRPNEGLNAVFDKGSKTIVFRNAEGQQAFEGNFTDLRPNEKGQAFSNGLAAVSKDKKPYGFKSYGFIDKTGKTIIPFEYFEVAAFKNNVAIVRKGERYGILDTTGREVEPLTFTSLKWMGTPSLIIGTKEAGRTVFGYFSPKGIPIPLKYYSPIVFHEGFSKVKGRDGRFGFINRKGQEVIPLIYEQANNFSEGLAAVKKKGKWGFIDSTGATVIPFQYFDSDKSFSFSFKDGVAPVSTNYTNLIYINKANKPITPELNYKNERAIPFDNGFTPIISGWKDRIDKINPNLKDQVPLYSIINTKGERINQETYAFASTSSLDLGLIYVCREFNCGFIDTAGKVIIPLEFQFGAKELRSNYYTLFHNGYLKVLSPDGKNTMGFMSLTGKKYWRD